MAKQIFQQAFGRLSWERPSWVKSAQSSINPKIVLTSLISFIILASVLVIGYQWYQSLPKPKLVTAQITVPEITPIDEEPHAKNLIIHFGTGVESSFLTASAAPLNQIDKEVSKGITISPAIKGTWQWIGSDQLVFYPEEPWDAGQTYQVVFEKNVFAKQIKMEKYSYDFQTTPFSARIREFKFYQDPTNPETKQAVATLEFNYPVNTQSLTNQLILKRQGSGKNYKYTIDYDQAHRIAYIHSELLTLEADPYYLVLEISKGLQPVKGNPSKETVSKKTLIPSMSRIFHVSNVSAVIARDAQNRPDQVLTVETSLGITANDLAKAIHAYQLPKDYPAKNGQEAKIDYSWANPGEVTEDILKQSQPITLQPIPTADRYSPLQSFKLKVPSDKYLYIQIDRSLKGIGDFNLSQDYQTVLQAPEFPREVNFLHPGSLLSLSSEKKLSVVVRGIPAVQFEIAKVLPNDLNHFITQTEGKFNSPRFINYNFNQSNISKLFSEVREFDTTDPSIAQYTALDLDQYLVNQPLDKKLGLFLLTINEWDAQNKRAGETKAKRLILITDMALITKTNIDGTHDVFVQSISQGTPVANASVKILGKNGLPLFTQNTDSEGHVHFPNLNDFTDDREPTVYLVEHGSDASFIPYGARDRELNYSRYDIGGVYQAELQNNLSAYLFSDRGIYRPGDLMHLGFIVKKAFAQQAPVGIPLEATITDPRGQTVLDQKLNLPESNLFTLDYKPSETAPTGQYSINLYTVKDGKLDGMLGNTTVQVQEFLPEQMKIKAQFDPAAPGGWLSPSNLIVRVNLQNLYGTPSQQRRVTGKVILDPRALEFESYKNYIFTDPLLDPKKPAKTIEQTLPETKTDNQGNAIFNLNLERFNKATYQLTFYTEGFEAESGRSVATQLTSLITPLPYLVGYKADSSLNYLKINTAHSIHFLAINQALQPVAVPNIKLELLSQQKITSLVKKPDGTYAYETVTQEVPVSDSTINISETGLNYSVPTHELGDYVLVLKNENDQVLSKVKFSIVGFGRGTAEKHNELSVKLNKTEYQPGEAIEMQITSPYAGSGLISIERDKTYTFKWFKADGNNSLQTITIPSDFQGDGYINIAMVRSWSSDDIFSNPLSYAVVPFSVNRAAHTVQIKLSAPELVKPGETIPITYNTDQPR